MLPKMFLVSLSKMLQLFWEFMHVTQNFFNKFITSVTIIFGIYALLKTFLINLSKVLQLSWEFMHGSIRVSYITDLKKMFCYQPCQ